MKKINILIFGSCIPTGTCSSWQITKDGICGKQGVGGLKIKTETRKSIENILKENPNYNVISTAEGYSHMCNTAISHKKRNIVKSVASKIINTDFSDTDIVLIYCSGGDFRNKCSVKGDPNDRNLDTFYGAYNMVFDHLDKYPNILPIFILPNYIKANNLFINKSIEYGYMLLRKMIIERGYKCISFYHYLRNQLKKSNLSKDMISFFFPDGLHPSIECQCMFVNYVDNKIKKIIQENNLLG